MLFSETIFVLLLTMLIACLIAIYFLIQAREHKKKETTYRVDYKSFQNQYKKISNNDQYILDPHEAKLLRAILKSPNNSGIDVNQINELLHLTKLSKENQRQRRHIVLKELNLKLYLISGVRETIKRIPSEADKRVKYYSFVPETPEFDTIKQLVFNQI